MAENRKYYYMKLKENFFESDKIVLLESLQDGYLYSNILMKLYLKSLKNDGRLVLAEYIPYNAQMLATITKHSVGTVEKALEYFKQLGLIEVLEDNVIYMIDIQNFIGKSSTETERKRAYRARIKADKEQKTRKIEQGKDCLGTISGQCPGHCPPEIEIELEKELEINNKSPKGDYESKKSSDIFTQIQELYNSICKSYPRLTKISEKRKKAINARMKTGYTLEDFQRVFEKAESSDFLKGKNKRDWSATFDWLICDSNMAKVLDGNYDNVKGGGLNEQKDNVSVQLW